MPTKPSTFCVLVQQVPFLLGFLASKTPCVLLFFPSSLLPSGLWPSTALFLPDFDTASPTHRFAHSQDSSFCILTKQAPCLLNFKPEGPYCCGFQTCKPPSFWFLAQEELSLMGFGPASPLPSLFWARMPPSFCILAQLAPFLLGFSPPISIPPEFQICKPPSFCILDQE